MSDDPGVDLTVRSAEKRDAGRGIARLPSSTMRSIGVLSGDTVVIEADRTTVAKVWPGGPGAEGGTIQIDGDTRSNAGASIGETVRVYKESVDDARSVVLSAPEELTDADVSHETIESAVKRDLRDRPIRQGEGVRIERLAGSRFTVAETDPTGTVRVTEATRLTVRQRGGIEKAVDRVTGGTKDSDADRSTDGVTYEDIGGLDEELELVREMIELPLSRPDVFTRLGIEPPKGVLLHGPPGTGKTLIAKAVANEVHASFRTISGPEIMSKYKGESEERLREVFDDAAENAPAIVFFDEIDSIAGKR
ncbi:MAG: AAA family ATPase, partial [Halobacteriota archaeon]